MPRLKFLFKVRFTNYSPTWITKLCQIVEQRICESLASSNLSNGMLLIYITYNNRESVKPQLVKTRFLLHFNGNANISKNQLFCFYKDKTVESVTILSQSRDALSLKALQVCEDFTCADSQIHEELIGFHMIDNAQSRLS